MAKLIDIISPIYQDLLKKCERRKVSVNLDIEDLTLRINNAEDIEKFYNKTHKQTNNNFNEKSLYDISQTIIDKLTNMGKQGYGIGK